MKLSFKSLALIVTSSTLLALGLGLALPMQAAAKQSPGYFQEIASIKQSELPKEGLKTLELIQKGGPFPYKDKDGSTFGNREGTLPKQKRGYYSEYTVKTPYARNRGAKRIIAGKGTTGDPASSGEYYYTDDHYATFKRVQLNK
jgi:ribonuclease T1